MNVSAWNLRPILSALRHYKVGTLVIIGQTAITLAILCNSLFIIQQRLNLSTQPTGLLEADVFTIDNQWIGIPTDLAARTQGDLVALRALPGVIDAYAANSYPLSNGGWGDGVALTPEQQTATTNSALYFADEHGLQTLGLHLIAGRYFTPAEVVDFRQQDHMPAAGVIVTHALANKLFPKGDALGKGFYVMTENQKVSIIGIVEQMQQPWASVNNASRSNSILEPFRYLSSYTHYMVRAQPGQAAAVIKATQARLMQLNKARLIDRVRTMPEARRIAYRDDRGLAIILSVVGIALMGVTAFGIIGVTSFWVTQRQRQIGIRRALGATRTAILRYFQTENLLIAATGALLGILLTVTLNVWLAGKFEVASIPFGHIAAAAAIVLTLGQLAVLWPALRAASISPAIAIRGAQVSPSAVATQ